MTNPRPGPRRARLPPLLLAGLLGLSLAAAPTPGHAADPPSPPTTSRASATTAARVTLTGASVADGSLTLSGTVTNAGSATLTEVTVALWRSASLLRTPEAVELALAAQTTTNGTARVVAPSNRWLLTGPGDQLAPGASRPFTVSGSLSALGLTQTDATWWVGVDVTGRGGGRRVPLGSARTLATRPEGTVPVARVVEFSASPRQVKQNLFVDEDLQAEVTDGRLAALMGLAEQGGAGWVVDPSLLVELADMADGYRVRATDGSVAGTGEAAAADWLARLDALPEPGAATLLGSPDLHTLAGLRDAMLLEAVRSTTQASTPTGMASVTVLDTPDAATLALAGELGRPVVAVDLAAPHVRVDVAGTRAVIARTTSPPVATSPLLPDTALNRRAARLALARAAGGEVRWVRSADEATDAGALPQGFAPATLDDVLATEPQPWVAPRTTDRAPVLDAAGLARVRDLREQMVVYGEAAPQAGVGTLADSQLARAASRWWVGRPDAQDAWLGALTERLATPSGSIVSLDASGRFSMTGPTSEFPVTVTNHLIDSVTIRIETFSDNPQRIRLVSRDSVTIEPGAASTVLLQAEASGGGVVRASVHARTLGGHRLTPDREIVVETTNFGTIGWVLVVGSGVVLVATTAHRIRQVRGQRKDEDG